MKMKKVKKGFTLIELIAVIAILGVLAAIVVPKMTGYSDSARLQREKSNAQSILNEVEIYNSTASTAIADTVDMTGIASVANTGDLNALTSLQGTVVKIMGTSNEKIVGTTTITKLKAFDAVSAYTSLVP